MLTRASQDLVVGIYNRSNEFPRCTVGRQTGTAALNSVVKARFSQVCFLKLRNNYFKKILVLNIELHIFVAMSFRAYGLMLSFTNTKLNFNFLRSSKLYNFKTKEGFVLSFKLCQSPNQHQTCHDCFCLRGADEVIFKCWVP